jgi:hypothetical protein
VRSWLSSVSRSSLLPLFAAVAYLAAALTTCPAVTVADHPGHGGDGTALSITAPCECGCEQVAGSVGFGKRVEPGLAPEPPAPLARARTVIDEVVARLPDAPIFREAPVPIAT